MKTWPMLLVLFVACGGGDGSTSQGAQGQPCYPNRTCNTGLTCNAQGVCVFAGQGAQGQPCRPDGSCDGALTCTGGICAVAGAGTGDCRDAERSCGAPFVCRANDTGKLSCISPVGDVPTCTGSPASQTVPFSTTESGKPSHWTLAQGCIPTTYEAALAARASEIAAALQAWSAVECARVCFDAPTQSDVTPNLERAERRVHFRVGPTGDAFVPALTMVNFEIATGRILGAEIIVEKPEKVEPSDFLQLVGYALGLSGVPGGTSTIMAQLTSPRSVTALTTDDRTAVCALYGTPSYCGE